MKTMLITGATSGIGLELAIQAAQRGYSVIACGRNQTKLDELASRANIVVKQFDVTDEAATREALANVDVDIAVLNAGVCEYVDVDNIEPNMFRRVFDANFFGVVNSVAALMPALRSGSQLVIVDSLARFLPFTRSQAYGASKAALHYLTKSLDVDLSEKGIIVQSVSPGFIKTPLTDKNDFEMTMLMPVEDAISAMLDGIEKQHRSIYFPRVFSFILRVLGHLWSSAQVAITKNIKTKTKSREPVL